MTMMKKITPGKQAELDAALGAGDPLTIEQLAWHLQVDPKHAPKIARSFGLEPEGRTYPWRRIWRHIHGTEGTRLPDHLTGVTAQHPNSVILGKIEDLQAALRRPLIDFATMARRLGQKPDTLSKALRQGRATLPFPMIDMGERLRRFRALEVRLWVEEEIALDLPRPPEWATPAKGKTATHADVADGAGAVAPQPCSRDDQQSTDPLKKAVFGHFAAGSPTYPT
jgi:hypothetical protein